MRNKRQSLTEDDVGKLIALLAVMFGGFLYLNPPRLAGFPINDGGLFHEMIRAIQANGFRLPAYVQYGNLSIPFAYPPLGFFVGAALSTMLRLTPLIVLQWLPAVVLVVTSIGVYRLGRRIMNSPIEAGIATFLYVCTPRSMTWLVMGGGLTRSLGHLFLVLTLASVYSLYTERRRKHLVLAVVFASLAVLSHPEAAIHTAASCMLFWIFRSRSRQGVLDSLAVAIGVLALTAVWWLPALQRHGLGPFLSAGQTGVNTPILLVFPFLMAFTEQPMITIIAALGLIGLMAGLARKEYLLPAWIFLPFLVEPRGASNVAVLPLALLGSVALHEVILPGIAAIQAKVRGAPFGNYAESGIVRLFVVYLGVLLLQLGTFAGTELSQVRLSDANQTAFRWVAANTPPDSRFLILTGEIELFCDPVQEWFPALTQRISETTIQGQEWTSNGGFFSTVTGLQQVQACLQADSPLDCVAGQAASMGLGFDYIYVSQAATKTFCRPTGAERRGTAVVRQLQSTEEFVDVYSTEDVRIFVVAR